MSAFMVGKEHIDALVTAGVTNFGVTYPMRWYHEGEGHELRNEDADRVGLMLWATNLESINARYPDTLEGEPLPGPIDLTPQGVAEYRFERTRGVVDPVVVLKLIDCYEYQSCEHDGWKDSEAFAFCESLRQDMIGRLPGYDKAPWELQTNVFPTALRSVRAS